MTKDGILAVNKSITIAPANTSSNTANGMSVLTAATNYATITVKAWSGALLQGDRYFNYRYVGQTALTGVLV